VVFSDPPGKCWDSTLNWPQPLSSASVPVHSTLYSKTYRRLEEGSEDNIKKYIKEIGWKDKDQWRALVNKVINLRILQNAANSLTSLTTISFSKKLRPMWFSQPHFICNNDLYFLERKFTSTEL
jgi:hypothetical protein